MRPRECSRSCPSCPRRTPRSLCLAMGARSSPRFGRSYRVREPARTRGGRQAWSGDPIAAAVAKAPRAIDTAVDAGERPPSLTTLAADASLSAPHLRREFVARVGITPKAYADLITISGYTKNGKTLLAQTLTNAFIQQRSFPLWFS